MPYELIYTKKLSRNDLDETGGHQSGILINREAASLLPKLNTSERVDETRLCIIFNGEVKDVRYVHYKSKGEYRITQIPKHWYHGVTSGQIMKIVKSNDDCLQLSFE